ncbi:DNA internalization-related competence protein ComEC/Rec2 [Bariatricus sp. SGI.154]|uniref:DNA internalization-related competence protein ComEC/Rec2 n=1 Tax=Bariatricus sp. SGI.154 TaxID=3420549 RepID=UPI003CFFAC51
MKNRPLLYVCLMILAAIVLAVTGGGSRFIRELRPSPLEQMASQEDVVTVYGQVYYLEQKENYQAVYLKKNSIQRISQIQHKEPSFQESKIIAYIDPNIQIHIGNMVEIKGEVSFFENARNPGNFDQKRYYQIQDIHGIVWATEVRLLDSSRWELKNALVEFRSKWKENLVDAMGEEDGTTMGAMMLGEKSDMDQELKALYQANGIGHILAISGLHLSFIGIGMYRILRRLTGSYPIGGIAGILFLVLYIVMIGLTVSAIRALVMFLFRVGADIAGRHYDAPTALAVAAVVTLVWRPLYLFDGGFWLSFGAVFAILTVLPVMQQTSAVKKYIGKSAGRRDAKKYSILVSFAQESVVQGLRASISIHLVILPILLYYFFEFPLYSFFLNLFVIPLMSVLLFTGMLGSICDTMIMPVSVVCFTLCRVILWIYKKSCDIAIMLPGARVVTGRPAIWQMVMYYMFLLLGVLTLKRKLLVSMESLKREKIEKGSNVKQDQQKKLYRDNIIMWKRCVVILWILSSLMLMIRWGEKGSLGVTMLDVGQGDGIFLKGPDGGTYLIDGGSSDVKNVGRYRIEPFLKSQGVSKIDYAFISHGDSDHMNGVEELISRQEIGVRIGTLVLPVQEVWDDNLKELAHKADSAGVKVAVIQPGQNLTEGEMNITCLQPGASKKIEPGNAASMVLAVRYGGYDMLLTGDVEEEGEENLTSLLALGYQDCTWEVLKVAHHGSKNSSSEEFLDSVCPKYALISAGQDNRYGHPHQETLYRLKDAGSKIYSTQDQGAIVIIVRDGRMRFNSDILK